MSNSNVSSFIKIGMGQFYTWGGDGGYSIAQIGLVTGENKHHLEISAGASFNWPETGWGDSAAGQPFSGNVGWRIQKPDGHFIFRMGLGLPETFYFGFGFSF